MAIVIGGAEVLATGKSNSSRPFADEPRNLSGRCGGISADHFPHTIDKNSGNGLVSSNGHGETLAAGFLLLDTSLQLMYASEEALAILAYPIVPSKNKRFDNFLKSKIRSLIPSNGNHNGSSASKFLTEVASGKRSYQLRAFSMQSNSEIERGPAIGLLLERNHIALPDLETVARKFRLSQRERETVDLLLQDLGTKQIAIRMNISPNTAKAFLRSVMIKVGAANRTGIIGKILQASKPRNEETSL